MNQKRVYNVLALFGQITVGLQGLSCIVMAAILLLMGGIFLGSKYDLVPATVDGPACDPSNNGNCGVVVTYTYDNKVITSSFETLQPTQYTPGDAVFIRVNPAHPTFISEDMPWRSMGLGMVIAALALGYLSWLAIHIVSDDKNIAAVAGSLSILQALV
jgi:hypothetical protein